VWSALTLNKQRDLTIDLNTINYLILTKLNKNTYSYFNFFRKRQQVIDSLKAKNDCTYSIRILEIIFKFLQYFYSGIRSNNNNKLITLFSAFLLASIFAVKKIVFAIVHFLSDFESFKQCTFFGSVSCVSLFQLKKNSKKLLVSSVMFPELLSFSKIYLDLGDPRKNFLFNILSC
jgi:hypothetical protein